MVLYLYKRIYREFSMKTVAHCKLRVAMFIIYVITSLFVSVLSQGNYESGKGTWSLIDISKCEEELETTHLAVEISKRRINRTNVGITAAMDAYTDINESYGVHIIVCKYMDGGCKHFQNITSASFPDLARTHGKENIKRVFEAAGIDPPDFPIPKGHHDIEDFIVDYCEITNDSVYGKFEVVMYLLLGNEKVSCLTGVLEFNKLEDDEDICQ